MSFYADLLADYKKHFLMYIALTIIFQSCLGSIAAMVIVSQDNDVLSIVELSVCVMVSMLYNTSLIASFKKEIAFNLLIISLVVNSTLILINIL
ncbi:hypothetical protein EGM88_06090 [Aureibaculum marinum]|uniref:Uncharacterized protein n=1 Tax=Aureibaculum marinum TaxID=2487930 RepID=A0A3N4NWX5_9FLAO|nr:hypothetical protein [Aureibaculum marinum]RPD98758.1 hypothetical protein EGM88_06090 [Aureibaculum marinum]